MKNGKTKQSFGHIEVPLKRVHLELTNICNFDCTFCPQSEMKRSSGFMDFGLAKKIIEELKANNICEKITFHVMGEPTLHPRFFEILDYAHEKGMKVGLTTNGASLTGKAGKRLVDYDLAQIDVSLQTPDERSFELRKAGKLLFEDYVNGITEFLVAYNIEEKGTTFKVRFLNTRFSSKNVMKKMKFIKVNSSSNQLHDSFRFWAGRIYDVLGVKGAERTGAFERIGRLVSYKWNVVEIYNNICFETYMLNNWSDAYEEMGLRDAWAGYCFGMRDHFAVLTNGDLVLCCIDFNGRTAIGNLEKSSLREILSSYRLGRIMDGFKKYRPVHPYCKKCLGSKTLAGWLFKPIGTILSLKVLKPVFYNQSSIWR